MGNKRLTETQSGFGAIEVECISNFNEVKKAKDRWDDLLEKTGINVPYLTFQWFCSALETIDWDKRPLLIFFKRNGEDIGLIPLVAKRKAFFLSKYWVVSFVQNPYTPYQGIIYDHDYISILVALVNFLRTKFGSRFTLDLDEVRPSIPEEEALLRLSKENLFLLCREPKSGSRYLVFKRDFTETVSALKKKTQKEFKRKIKRLSRLGKISITRVSGEKELDENLKRFFSFYARTWKGAEPHPEFYHKLCTWFDQLGKLYFYSLKIDNEPIAYLICIAGNDVMYGIKTTYNPSYYAFSPGVVLFYKAIEDMFNVPGIREFDIGRGHEQFKREWTSLVHQHTRIVLYPYAAHWRILDYGRRTVVPKIREHRGADRLYSMLRNASRTSNESGERKSSRRKEPEERVIRCSEYKSFQIPPDLTMRFATADDLDKLVVAMAARNFRSVQDRLQKGKCVLILRQNKILGYFWLSSKCGTKPQEQNDNTSQNIHINDWGLPGEVADRTACEQVIKVLARFVFDAYPGVNLISIVFPPRCRG